MKRLSTHFFEKPAVQARPGPVLAATLGCALVCMLSTSAALADSIIFSSNFAGNAGTNWGWDSTTDPNTQLSGTNQMTYTYGGTNGNSYVTHNLSQSDLNNDFPNGTGTITTHFRVDLSNFPLTTTAPGSIALAQITAPGNRADWDGGFGTGSGMGMLSSVQTGWGGGGHFAFWTSVSGTWSPGASNYAFTTLGTNPAFPLVYDVTWAVTVSGSVNNWTATSDFSAVGPTDSAGTIGTIAFSATSNLGGNLSSNGLASILGYNVGVGGRAGSVSPGSSITFDSFSASTGVPEPASLSMGLLGLGIIALGRRRVRQSV